MKQICLWTLLRHVIQASVEADFNMKCYSLLTVRCTIVFTRDISAVLSAYYLFYKRSAVLSAYYLFNKVLSQGKTLRCLAYIHGSPQLLLLVYIQFFIDFCFSYFPCSCFSWLSACFTQHELQDSLTVIGCWYMNYLAVIFSNNYKVDCCLWWPWI